MTEPNVGYIGLNHHHCRPYFESIAQLPAEITCVCEPDEHLDVDPPDLIPFYRDYREMFEREEVDVAWITMSNKATPEIITAAADRGLDVFTEKPVARTAAELEPVSDRVRESTSRVCVSYPWRAHPVIRDVREYVDDGFFGEPIDFEARFVASRPEFRDTDHYLFDETESRGGIVQWLGVHWLDLIPWLLRDPIARVDARTSSRSSGIDVDDFASIILETRSGAQGTLRCGYHLGEDRYDTNIALYGENGRMSWDPTGERFSFDDGTSLDVESFSDRWSSAPRRTTSYEYASSGGYGGAWGVNFVREFLDARAEGTNVPVTLDEALAVLRVLDAIYESADGNGPVVVET